MMQAVRTWWRERTGREQMLLGIMLVLAAGIIGWFGVVQPLRVARTDAAERLERANADLADITAKSTSIRTAEARGRVDASSPLLESVRVRATDAEIPVDALVANGEGAVTLRIAAIKPAALLGWIADLEVRDGIAVDRLVLTPNADATVAAELGLRRQR